ncbi:MAG: AAA family ATPase [Candidatus Bathyarchaeota archaeon]
MLHNIRIDNFKSFKKLDVTLNQFNVLIGANASGKSNFVSIFSFLKDIVSNGWRIQYRYKVEQNMSET